MVTADPGEAEGALGRGEKVVLIVPPGAEGAAAAARPGRLAVLVGDPADPAVWAAARAMTGELFP